MATPRPLDTQGPITHKPMVWMSMVMCAQQQAVGTTALPQGFTTHTSTRQTLVWEPTLECVRLSGTRLSAFLRNGVRRPAGVLTTSWHGSKRMHRRKHKPSQSALQPAQLV
jgi:hypothetical protein